MTTWYARHVGGRLQPGSGAALDVARTVRALASAEELPGPGDFEGATRPVGRAWVRRVAGRNEWLWYRFNPEEVILLTTTTEPPVPVGEGC